MTIRLDESTVEYFKALAEETELPNQSWTIRTFATARLRTDDRH